MRDGPPTPTFKDHYIVVAGRYLVLQTFLVGVIAGMVVTVFGECFLCVRLFLTPTRGKG
jgi:hypothetical protein